MAWTAAAAGHGRLFKDSEDLSSQEQHLALVEGCDNCSEQELRSRLSQFAQVAWCNAAGPGKFLVRFVSQEGLAAVTRALGGAIQIEPYASRNLLPQQESLVPRAESIPAMLPDQLDYLNLLLSEEAAAHSEAQQQLEPGRLPTGVSIFMQHGLQDLDPSAYEWNPLHHSGSLFASLEDEPLSADDSPMHSFSSSGPSTCQLWTQRSIGATARKDLAKFAALQNMAQQHSNSSTPGPGLAPASSGLGGLVSPWGSISSAHSSSMEAVAAVAAAASKLTVDVSMAVRRTSSPGGLGAQQQQQQQQQQHPVACLTPRSPCGYPSNADAMLAAMQQQQQFGPASGTPGVPAPGGAWGCAGSFGALQQQQLPADLAPQHGFDGTLCDEPGEMVERFRLQAMMAAQQQQQQGGGMGQDGMPAMLSLGLLGGLSAAAGAPQQQAGMGGLAGGLGAGDHHHLDSLDVHGILGLAGPVPPPPPHPAQQQQQHAGMSGMPPPPPPPPPGGSRPNGSQQQAAGAGPDGRMGSPVHAGVPAPPPPRAMTPGSGASPGSGMWASPCVSPRYSGPSQASSPNSGFRGGPRQVNRGLPGMSNLAHCTSGSPTPGQAAMPFLDGSCQQQQPPQPPYPRIGSPLQRGVPPPPPPPPGYAAAAAAAAAACGSGSGSCSPVVPPLPLGAFMAGSVIPGPPGSPASGRGGPGSVCSPRPPAGLESMGSSGRHGAPPPPWAQQGGNGSAINANSNNSNINLPERSAGSQAAVAAAAAAAAMAAISGSTAGASAALTTAGQGAAARPAAAGATAGAAAAAEPAALRADGALFVRELLQLLKGGSAAGSNPFLANLQDLLDCALSASEQLSEEPSSSSGSGSHRRSSSAASTSKADKGGSRAAAVDAAAFLGMLQEAAAPLMAAAAMAASQGRGNGGASSSGAGSSSQASRRGSVRASDASDAAGGLSGGSAAGGKPGDGAGPKGAGLRALRMERCSSAAGDSGTSAGGTAAAAAAAEAADGLPQQLLLRHQLSRGGSASGSGSPSGSGTGPLFYPLHPRTTTHGCRDAGSSSSCGGAAPGTPHGTPMLLVPQTAHELLSARAALMRLMAGAYEFVTSSPGYARMAERLGSIGELYDSMHDDPVVVKRRKCRDMAAMRDGIRHEPQFAQTVSSLSSLRNHIYSLSRKVLIGYGHVEGLPVDLLLGGLTSELAAILAEPSAPLPPALQSQQQQQQQQQRGQPTPASASAGGDAAGGSSEACTDAAAAGSGCLPQQVLDFYTSVLPLPKLALLVFTEFVGVDPSPSCIAIPAAAAAAAAADAAPAFTPSAGTGAGGGGSSSGGALLGRPSSLRDRRSSGSCHDSAGGSGDEGGHSRPGRGQASGSSRMCFGGREGSGREHHHHQHHHQHQQQGRGSNGGHDGRGERRERGSRGGSFSSGGGSGGEGGSGGSSGGGSRRTSRRSCEFDLVAEAAALEAAATAAAPLVAAAVCDLPSGRKQRGSSSSDS